MEADMADVQQMLLESATDFLRTEHSMKRVHRLRESGAPLDSGVWKKMAQLGWLAMTLPEARGGAGLDIAQAAELAALFGEALLIEPFATSAVAPAAMLAVAPESALCRSLAQSLCEGGEVLSLAWQDRLGQVDPAWDGLTAEAHEGGFRLHGRKLLVDAAATQCLVTGMAGGTPIVVSVAADTENVSRKAQRMADGSSTLTLDFEGTRVSAGAVLLRGEDARSALAHALDQSRLVLAAQLAGIAAGAQTHSVAYLSQRVQFGQSLSAFQVLRHRLVDLDLQNRLAFASWRHAARICSSSAARSAAISAAKARCSEAAIGASRAAIQFHGAFGYTQEADVGLFVHAALRHASSLGNAEVHRRRFADLTLLERLAA